MQRSAFSRARRPWGQALLAALLALVALLAAPQPPTAHADVTITVNDPSGAFGGDGKSSTCTLFEAVQAANDANNKPYDGCPAGSSVPGVPDLITFSVPGVITLEDPLNINSNIAMLGPVAISSDGDNRLFNVSANGTFSLSLMTLQNGKSSGGGGAIQVNGGTLNIAAVSFEGNQADGNGGAIDSSGTVRIAAGNFVGNSAGGDGGAIRSGGGGTSLTIAAATFSGNQATGSGGAVYNSNSNSSSEMADVAFSGNIAGQDASSGGGAIFNAQGGRLSLVRIAFSGNLSPSGNGGALFNNSGATTVISDTSFQGNLAGTPPTTERLGGAIYNAEDVSLNRVTFLNNGVVGDGGAIANDRLGSLTLTNVSFTANAATGRGGGLANLNSQQGGAAGTTASGTNLSFSFNAALLSGGGGIFNGAGHVVRLANTIVADSFVIDSSDAGSNCSGPITSQGHNLDTENSCSFNQTGDLRNANAALGVPDFHGGPLVSLLTQQPGPDSDAIDAGDPARCAAAPVGNLDQRSEPRPQDGDGNGQSSCDIGAFESETRVAGYGSAPVQPGPIDIGNAIANSGAVDGSFSVFETGNRTLQVNTPTLGGANPDDFTVKSGPPFSIADGAAARQVTVTCTPKALGERSATLRFGTNDPQRPSVTYNLLCIGTAAPQAGFGANPPAPGPIELGAVVVGQQRSTTFAIQETGNATLQVNTPTLGGANPGDFLVVGGVNLSLANGAPPANVTVACKPTAPGIRTATLTLTTNDPTLPQVSFTMSCSGLNPPNPPLVPSSRVPAATLPGGAGSLNGPYGVAVSPDGRSLYLAGNLSDSLIGFRLTASGQIDQSVTPQVFRDGVNSVDGLNGALLVNVSPDGRNVYVGGSLDNGVAIFTRDTETGALTFDTRVGNGSNYACLPTCSQVSGMTGAYEALISPDGRYVYVSSITSHTISVFTRDSATGRLGGVFGPAPTQQFTSADLSQAYGMAISPDGSTLYATSYDSSTVLVLERNAINGQLSQIQKLTQGQAGVDGINGVFRIALSPDGGYAYTASYDGNSVAVFKRNPVDGRLTYRQKLVNGENGVDGLASGTSVTVSPDGRYVYATGYDGQAVVAFERDSSSGLLTYAQAVKRGANGEPPLDGARDVRVSPDGRTLYASAYDDDALVLLALANPRPTLESITPPSTEAGSPAFILELNGADFVEGATVSFGGVNLATSFVSSSRLTAVVPAAQVQSAGVSNVLVRNPAPGGGDSNIVRFVVTAPNQNPLPAISEIVPQGAAAGSPSLLLTIKGANFLPSSQVYWNGAGRVTSFVSSTQLEITLTAADLAQPGSAGVTVVNPAPGGGSSNAASFTIAAPGQNPVPVITRLDPASLIAGSLTSASFNLTVVGSGFADGAVVRWNGEDRPTTRVSGSQLRAAISAADVALAGSAGVTVVNPAPGGGESNTLTFRIGSRGDHPVPVASSYTLVRNNASSLRLTISGRGFVSGAVVRWNGANRTTTVVNANQVTAIIPVTDISTTGLISVNNPTPGGGPSNELQFTPRRQYLPLLRRR